MSQKLLCIGLFNTILFFCLNSSAQAATLNIKLSKSTSIKVRTYPASGENILIWLPSEYGTIFSDYIIAKKIQNLGLEVWLPDLFTANYTQPSRNSINQINLWQVRALIRNIYQRSRKKIWLFSSSTGAILALRSMRQWQIHNPEKTYLRSAVLLNPKLTYGGAISWL